MAPVVMRWLALLGAMAAIVSSSLSQKRVLTVERGRSAFLHPSDLTFDLEEGEHCQVQVVTFEPATQRVGRLQPQMFDCLFLPYTVQYWHHGSPLVNTDRVILEVYRSKVGEEVRTETLELVIEVTESPYEVIIDDPNLRTLEVKEFQGLSGVINNAVMRFRYHYYNGAVCTVSFNQEESHWPVAGQVVWGNSNQPIKSFKYNCREFLFLGHKYKHLHAPTPDTDYIPLKLEVSDQTMGAEPIVEYYYLPIKINGAFPNNPPKLTIPGSNILEVTERSLTPLDTEMFLAEDKETLAENIMFQVIQPDGVDNGYFVRMEDFSRPLRSFMQRDLFENSIGFLAPISEQKGKVVKIELVAVDQNFDTSSPVTLHIAVEVATDIGPRLIENKGLILREGSYAAITSKHLKIVDSDNSYNVEVHVKGGLRSGRLEVAGRETDVFSLEDLDQGTVVYYHDGRDAIEDKMILRITDGERNIRTKFFIKVLQEDDAAPSLIRNTGVDVRLGGEVQITPLALTAKDRDSPEDDILYILKTTPAHGVVMRKLKPMTEGKTVSQFTQTDLDKGYVYYRHSGGNRLADSFEVRLLDNNDPPNKSGRFIVNVTVYPEPHEPPHLVKGTSLKVTVKETEIMMLTNDHLSYKNLNDEDNDIMYTITSLPYFLTTTITIDAGRFFNAQNVTRLMKDASFMPIFVFTQQDINKKRIAYMPPMEDIGPIQRVANMQFAVSDSNGNQLLEQVFEITILPENNQVPHLSLHPLQVWEGGTATVTPRDIMAYDPDTDQSDLVFVIEDQPKYGLLLKGETRMTRGQHFSQEDLSNGIISYIHDGSEVSEDSFGISVSDGMNKFTKVMKVAIEMVSNQEPRPLPDLQNSITVTEGGEIVLSTLNIGATDNDTEDMSLMFMLVKPPLLGEIRVGNRPAKEFSQHDLARGGVRYVHTDGEIGMATMLDTITFLIMDESLATKAGNHIPLLDLNITVVPVDNAQPELVLGEPLLVNEGQRALISFEILSAHDLDTPPEAIGFIVANAPKYGFIENSKRPSGPEKRNAGKTVSSFMLVDLKDGSINYVSNSENDLPEEDSFAVYVTDGKQSSPSAKVNVIIVPDQQNNLLVFDMDQLVVDEGSHRVFDVHLAENPNPENHWMLSLEKPPRNGELLLAMDSPDLGGMMELPLREVSMLDMGRNMHLLYRHDGSETNKDIFTLKVSDGEMSATKISPVIIIPVNDEIPQLVVNAELAVNASDEAFITDDVLMAVDDDNQNAEVYFVVTSAPSHGVLQRVVYNGYNVVPQVPPLLTGNWQQMKVGDNFTQRHVYEKTVRYIHTDQTLWSDNDSFNFQLTDGVNALPTETFRLRIVGGRPHELTVLNNGLTVHQGETVRITADLLSASDESHSKPEEILYRVSREPQHGRVVTPDTKIRMTSFTQRDIQNGAVAYMQTNPSRFTEDVVGLTIVNNFNYSTNANFKVKIEFLDKRPPSLDTNMALTVEQGDQVFIRPSNLHITDPDTDPSNLTYIVLEGPHSGKLYNRHGPTQVFTQHEVDASEVSYRSERRSESGLDFFLFTITDNHHENFLINGTRETQPAFFNILIQPMTKRPPRIVVNEAPTTLEFLSKDKYGFVLTSRHLRAEHPLSTSVDIIYSVDEKPQHGYLEHLGTRRPIKKRFSQKDLDDARVAFVLEERVDVTNDSFVFRVYDRNRNTLDNQRFSLHWAIIEMAQPQYFVCEDAEILRLQVVRSGDTTVASSVGIKTKGMSAKEGLDYHVPASDLIEFKPGDTNVTWAITISMDRERENIEKFKVLLRRPNNALIGENDKTIVQIVNYEYGRCDEYIGMISKQMAEAPSNRDFFSPNAENPFDTPVSRDEYDQFFGPQEAFDVFTKTSGGRGGNHGNAGGSSTVGGRNTFNQNAGGKPKNHPMNKYREESGGPHSNRGGNLGNGNQGGRGRKGKKGRGKNRKQQKGTFDETGMDSFPENEDSQNTEMLPQSCTPDTQGLLYFDLLSSKMYRCNGFQWEHWGWGAGNLHYATMLQDAGTPAAKGSTPTLAAGDTKGGDFVPLQEETSAQKQCPKGWTQWRESCYRFYSHKVAWSEAEQLCQEEGATLTEVATSRHQDFLWELSKQRSFWIGLNDQRVGGAWEYTNEATVRYFNWRRGFPRAPRFYKANCVLVSKRAQWVNRECETRKSRYVCSKPLKPRRKRHQHKHRQSWFYENQ